MDSAAALAYKQANPTIKIYYVPEVNLTVTLGVATLAVSTTGSYVVMCPVCQQMIGDQDLHNKKGHP